MNISNIYNYYKALTNNTSNTSNTSSSSEDSSSDKSTTINKLIDQLELSSDSSDLTGYLNYNASGSYQKSLADYLNSDTDTSSDDALSELLNGSDSDSSTQGIDLDGYLSEISSDGQSGSYDDMINGIINQRTAYDNALISAALKRFESSDSEKEATTAKTTSSTESVK